MVLKAIMLSGACVLFAGCASIAESTNSLSDEQLKSQTGGVLGYSSGDLAITSRRTAGTNTYVSLKATDGKEFACVVNGGNLLTMGVVNPPLCNKKGEPTTTNPFQH